MTKPQTDSVPRGPSPLDLAGQPHRDIERHPDRRCSGEGRSTRRSGSGQRPEDKEVTRVQGPHLLRRPVPSHGAPPQV